MAPPWWSCEICCEGFRDYTSIDIDGSPVCVSCVRKMFDKALEFEHDYPPNWAGPLHPSEFSHILTKDYIDNYERKEIEYKTPITKRVYCQHNLPSVEVQSNGEVKIDLARCGEFIGPRRGRSQPEILTLGRCNGCKRATCMVCDDYSEDPLHLLSHDCPGKSLANETRAKAFLGLKRGKDWQQCPSKLCGRRIELSAACNHITCQCGKGFCFICGKGADGESDHWRKGGCPRYNQPGDDDVEYDDGYDDEDDEVSVLSDAEDDVLENVRGLFEDEGDDGFTELLEGPVALSVEHRMDARESEAVANVINGLFDDLVYDIEGHAATQLPNMEGSPPPPPEADMPDPRDAEAIAHVLLQDDWSNEGRLEYRLLSAEVLRETMTAEEFEMDQALWRMRMD